MFVPAVLSTSLCLAPKATVSLTIRRLSNAALTFLQAVVEVNYSSHTRQMVIFLHHLQKNMPQTAESCAPSWLFLLAVQIYILKAKCLASYCIHIRCACPRVLRTITLRQRLGCLSLILVSIPHGMHLRLQIPKKGLGR